MTEWTKSEKKALGKTWTVVKNENRAKLLSLLSILLAEFYYAFSFSKQVMPPVMKEDNV